jgi:hypothetical protein
MRGTTDGRSSAAWYGGDDARGEQMRQSALMKLVWWLGVAALFVVIGAMIAAIIVLAVRIDDIDKERGPRGLPGRDGTTLVVPFLNGLYVERVNQTNITTAAYIAGALGFRVQTSSSNTGQIGGSQSNQFGTNYFIKQLVRYKNSTFNVLATCSGVATYGFLLANGTQIICTSDGKASYVFNPATGATIVNNANYLSSTTDCSSNIIFLGNPGWVVTSGLTSDEGGMTFLLDMFFMASSVTSNVATFDVQCTFVNILP